MICWYLLIINKLPHEKLCLEAPGALQALERTELVDYESRLLDRRLALAR